ncbi:MAG: hypothetical protein ABIY55_02220 [Kofleriaceae bacterium]
MSTSGGPGGIGGIKGPDGPDGPDGVPDVDEVGDVHDVGDVGDVHDVAGKAAVEQAPLAQIGGAAATGDVAALAAEVAAGRLTPHEAIDRLVEATAGPGLDASERAELRELLTDLVTNDPHLGALVGRI